MENESDADHRQSKQDLADKLSTIPVQDVVGLIMCGRCKKAPIMPPVFQCSQSHLNCGECYYSKFRNCFDCKEVLEHRNFLVEKTVHKMSLKACTALREYTDSPTIEEAKSDESLVVTLYDPTHPSHLEKLEEARLEQVSFLDTREIGGSGEVTNSVSFTTMSMRNSYRPIMCPYPCERIVTCSGLFPHFELQHPEVILSYVFKGVAYTIDIKSKDIMEPDRRCFSFFVVMLNDKADGDSVRWSAANLLKLTRSTHEMLRNGCFISTLSLARVVDRDDCFLALWATSLYEHNPVTYTLQLSSEVSEIAFSFTGPLIPLHESQEPEDMFNQGRCLIITSSHLEAMSFPQYDLKLAITFHSDIAVPPLLPLVKANRVIKSSSSQ